MTLQNSVFLAPMAGVTDRAFRELAMEFGATGTFSEMISAKGLYYNDKKTAAMLQTSEREQPLFVQLFGHEPELMGSVVEKALSYGGRYIDINSGCPAPKIVNNGDGSALMKNPLLFGKVIEAVAKASPVPVSVKIRKGWDDRSVNAVELAKIAEQSGAAMLTIHGRTTKQGYSGRADWDIISRVVAAVAIPVIGNGDIFEPEDAVRMQKQTGCAGVMLGRGTLGNPHLIKRTAHLLATGELLPPPTVRQRIELAKRHIGAIVAHKGERIGIREARKHGIWYSKGIRGSAKVKALLTSAQTYREMCGYLDLLVEQSGGGTESAAPGMGNL